MNSLSSISYGGFYRDFSPTIAAIRSINAELTIAVEKVDQVAMDTMFNQNYPIFMHGYQSLVREYNRSLFSYPLICSEMMSLEIEKYRFKELVLACRCRVEFNHLYNAISELNFLLKEACEEGNRLVIAKAIYLTYSEFETRYKDFIGDYKPVFDMPSIKSQMVDLEAERIKFSLLKTRGLGVLYPYL
jgi:hypothetical protein